MPRLRPAPGGGSGPGVPAHARSRAGELWLAVHLPRHVLESLEVRAPFVPRGPVVVVDLQAHGRVVCDRDAAAAAGVTIGMALNSALALRPDLEVRARDPSAERTLLESVSACAGDYTPRVSLEPPDGVLLEVRGSLRLFGGARRLIASLRTRQRR